MKSAGLNILLLVVAGAFFFGIPSIAMRTFETSSTVGLSGNAIPVQADGTICEASESPEIPLTSYPSNCRLVVSRLGAEPGVCSAELITKRAALTAAHCLVDPNEGLKLINATISCGTGDLCSGRAIRVTRAVWTPKWGLSGIHQTASPFDAALVGLAEGVELPPGSGPHEFGPISVVGDSVNITVTGYPDSSGSGLCSTMQDATCRQRSSYGIWKGNVLDGYLDAKYNACPGMSGASIIEGNKIIGVHVSPVRQPCVNMAVRLVSESDEGCDGYHGGVDVGCLLEKLGNQYK
jgi:Trypsin